MARRTAACTMSSRWLSACACAAGWCRVRATQKQALVTGIGIRMRVMGSGVGRQLPACLPACLPTCSRPSHATLLPQPTRALRAPRRSR